MARLFGMIGNRPDLGAKALASEVDALCVRSQGSPLGWGIGFYQSGEVLMRRRPIDDRASIDVAKIAADVRADTLIGHVRSATIGSLRTENTHPFRSRQWLFAQTGTLSEFDQIRERVVQSVPEFLRGGIRGETDSEVLFYVFLSFLHDAGRLNDTLPEASVVRDALRSSVTVVDGMAAEVGGAPSQLNVFVTNGELIVALHRSGTMATRLFSGKSDADALIGDDLALRRKTPELSHMHFSLIASDFDQAPSSRWNVLSQNAIVTLARGQDPQSEAL
jgi:predicted glutamine amidotransferase